MKKLFLIGCLILTTSSCQAINPAPQIESTPLISATATPIETVTPAPTRSATPAPTRSATSTPVPMFFTEEFNSDLGAWTSFQTGGAESAAPILENDALRVVMMSPNTWYYAIHNAHEYPAVFVSAKFSMAPTGSAGMLCSYSEANGWYEFNVASDGSYSVLFGQWLTSGIAQYKPVTTNTTEYLQAGNLSYEIGMTCGGDILLLYINGKMFRKVDVARFGLTEGKVGISASSFEETPMNAIFEWFRVSQPE